MLQTGGLSTQSGTSLTYELDFLAMLSALFVGLLVDGCDRRGIVVGTTLARRGRELFFVSSHACLPEMVAGLLALKF